jgi:sorting nexin-8
MSLFGADPPMTTPTRRAKASASLFADDDDAGPASAAATAGSALTASSPLSSWTPVPSAKRASMRGAALLRSLVPPGQAPDEYVDAYDRLAAENKTGGGGVDAATVRDVLVQSAVGDDAAAQIRKTVMPDESRDLGRAEVNVLFAMIGLAQEGEDVTLDGVDERRRSELPGYLVPAGFDKVSRFADPFPWLIRHEKGCQYSLRSRISRAYKFG